MRSYKSIERPAQVLGMNIQDLGIMVGLFIGSVLLLGFLGMAVKIPRLVYLLVILVGAGPDSGPALPEQARRRPAF